MFTQPNPRQSFPELERDILHFWDQEKIFERSLEKETEKTFTFYDGPPFGTGLPHYGHLLAGTMKDVIPRYWTMKGYRVPRRFGWDCHGLPVENLIEKELGLKSKKEIEEFGIGKFNDACRDSVLRYVEEWKKTVRRVGRWVDMERDYKTMNPEYMESIWWVFKSVWDKGLMYKGHKPMHICPRCETPLSNFEVTLGYKDITDFSATVSFRARTANTFVQEGDRFLAWTTTPWSLPGNVALAVHPEHSYARVSFNDHIYIVGEERIPALFPEEGTFTILGTAPGKDLHGIHYTPLFPYYTFPEENAFSVVTESFVSFEDGTGIVHIAPAFGEDDMQTGKNHNLPFVQHVELDGSFAKEVTDFAGEQVKPIEDPRKTDQKIVSYLETHDHLFKKESYKHSYPHCWRCDSPLLNYAFSTWFINVEAIKERLLSHNKTIHWTPEHIQEGRFGKWLENARDWAISRNRFWGTPLPIWECTENPEEPHYHCVTDRAELEKLTNTPVTDLHKQYVDALTFPCTTCKGTMHRVPEVLDCWFESGSMPYASEHYPFEHKEAFEGRFPADFIAEGQDQTRGWFYTLHILSTILFDQPAFKNVIVNGMLLASDGKKLSKKLRNYTEPEVILEEVGADALRFYLMHSPAVYAESLRVNDKDIDEVVKSIILPLWNTYSFFTTYANIDGWTSEKRVPLSTLSNTLDRWILSELHTTLQSTTEALESYDLFRATDGMTQFLEHLTNWYVRRSRRRFWKSENDGDKNEAYTTLYEVLVRFSQMLCPFMPFVTEEIYKNLTGELSVHLSTWPSVDTSLVHTSLNEEIETVQAIVKLGHAARAKAKMKVRQPLPKIVLNLPERTRTLLVDEHYEVIKEELNIKEVEVTEELLGTLVCKPNAKLLGPKYGKEVQTIIQTAKSGNFEKLPSGEVRVLSYTLSPEEIEIGYVGKEGENLESDQGIVLKLDTTLTEALQREGIARDIVRSIQDLRKSADLNVADRIHVFVETALPEVQATLKDFGAYIQKETLTETLTENVFASPLAESQIQGVHIGIRTL